MSDDLQSPPAISLLDVIVSNDRNDVHDEDLGNVALDIHTNLRLHETSIIERHMSPFARCYITAKDETLQTAYAKLSRYVKSDSASLSTGTRVSALKTICILTVEHPYMRRVWKEDRETCGHLKRLADTSDESCIREWAQIARDAIYEEDVHRIWSIMITEPISVYDVEQLSNTAACDRVDLAELKNTLSDSKTKYVAGLYLKRVTKLAKDGSSKNVVEVVGDHLRFVQQYDVARTDPYTLKNLCMKLLKYARCSTTAVAAMDKIVALTVENPSVRKTLKGSKEACDTLRDILANSPPELRECAIRSLYAVENEDVHNLWSKAIEAPAVRHEMQQLYETVDRTRTGKGLLAKLARTLREPKSSSLATAYLEHAKHLSEQSVESINRNIHLLAEHGQNSIRQLLSGHSRSSVDVHKLRASLSELLKYSEPSLGFLSTRLMSLEAISVLAIEDSYVRGILKDDKDILCRLRNLAESSRNEIKQTASTTINAIEDDEVHGLWSTFLLGSVDPKDVQRLLNKTATNDNPLLTALLTSLSDSKTESLAALHLELAAKLVGDDASRRDDLLTDAPDGAAVKDQLESKMCSTCKQSHPQYPLSSEELLKYVLKSAPEDSLPDLTDVIPSPQASDRGDTLGEGGFSEVYTISTKIKGKDVAVKLLKINNREFLHCKGRFVVRNFARELRILSRLSHSNVLNFLGYAILEDQHYFIVTEWMERGNLKGCIDDLKMTEIFEMSLGIAKGVSYLHEKGIVHGDLKSLNVLVSSSGEPVLADFGLAKMAESLWSVGYYSTVTARASYRWVPYEFYDLPDDEIFRPNQKTDVWAFGMTLLEILTRDVPYAYIASQGKVAAAIINKRPPVENIPTFEESDHDRYLKRDLWSLCGKCFIIEQTARPSLQECLRELIKMNYRHSIRLGQALS